MRDNPIGDVDGEVIRRIAGASLCHEKEIPGTVVRRAGLRLRDEGNEKADGGRSRDKFFNSFAPKLSSWTGDRNGAQAPDSGRLWDAATPPDAACRPGTSRYTRHG